MSTRWRWPPLALFAVIDSVQAIDQDMVLYLGCTIGGLVFLLLIVILFILVCKRPNEKPRHSSNSLNSRAGWPVGPVPAQVPPGVWTSNPSMQALRHKHMMLHQPAKLSSHPGHHVNGYANRKPQPVVNSAPMPWYLRTVRYAHNKLKHIPSARQTAPPKKQAPAPPRLSGEKRSRGHHPTRDKTVREMTLKLEDDERFPQQQNCGIRVEGGGEWAGEVEGGGEWDGEVEGGGERAGEVVL
ncbi:hypothetical protein LSAT2_013177 [Lamellibrachia satsuma]|nr:hypothetical protein LSAT2_013177 [Lamellibrachia satsuma]